MKLSPPIGVNLSLKPLKNLAFILLPDPPRIPLIVGYGVHTSRVGNQMTEKNGNLFF